MTQITIVTVCRNAESTIGRTLESVASQKNLPGGAIEHWVIDGGSTDRTIEIVNGFPNVKWISERDNGIADAFNKGIGKAAGTWIQILNSDDALASDDVLCSILNELDSSYDFIYGRLALMDATLSKQLRIIGHEDGWKYLSRRMSVPHPALFTKKTVFERYGLFDTSFRIAMDYEWMLRSYGVSRYKFVPKTISLFRNGGVSTSDNWILQASECRIAKAKNNISTPSLRFIWFIYQAARHFLDSRVPSWPVIGSVYTLIAERLKKKF